MTDVVNKNLEALVNAFNSGKRGVVMDGGSRCFASNQLIATSRGVKPIIDVIPGDYVLSHNHHTNENEFRQVLDTIVNTGNKKKCYKIKLKNGHTITCSYDHKFFFNGRYIEIENILSLLKK